MKKNENQKLKDEIILKYNNGISMRKLEREYKCSFTFINQVIKSENLKDIIELNYPQKKNHDMWAICKKTNKEFIDYSNTSGVITKHLVSLYSINIPSKFKRKAYQQATGKFWYDEYFDFIYKEKESQKCCHYCDWKTSDIYNLAGSYKIHIKTVHNLTVKEHLSNHPEDNSYFKEKAEPDDGVVCQICGKKMNIINAKHLAKHNITVFDYKLKYSENIVSYNTHNKLSKSTTELNKTLIKSNTSKAENEIKNFLIKHGIKLLQSTRKYTNGVEIDLLSIDDRIGIEYNGNLYHSELYGKKNKNYHLNKTKIAANNNICLYHIQEDEWLFKKDIVKSILLEQFNKSSNIIYAKNCIIKEIDSIEKSEFLNRNHILGNDKSTINIGAFYNGVLSAVITFNKQKNHKNKTYYLSRFTNHINHNIIDMGDEFLKYFISHYNPDNIITYSDRRWTPDINNNFYTKLGFKCISVGYPDYYYLNGKIERLKRFHKIQYNKNSIKKRYPDIYDKNKTEWQMMQELGFDRIWDCGKVKYELIVK